MHRLHLSRHALPAALAIAASLLAPLFAGGGPVSGAAGSATARAAVNEDVGAVASPDTRFAVGSEAMTVARQIADQHWAAAACSGQVNVVWTQLADDTNATAAWRNPTDAWNNAAENFDCVVEFNARSDYDWPKFCTVMAHEMGHLLGNPHSDAGGQLMSPVYAEPLPACTGAEPGAPAPAPVDLALTEELEGDEAGETVVLRATKKPAAKKKKVTRSKRCTRSFRAGRRVLRCAKVSRKAAKASRKRR